MKKSKYKKWHKNAAKLWKIIDALDLNISVYTLVGIYIGSDYCSNMSIGSFCKLIRTGEIKLNEKILEEIRNA